MSEIIVSKMAVLRTRLDYQGSILGVVCAVVTLLLLIGQQVTFDPIQRQIAADRADVLNQVLPAYYYDNEPLQTTTVIQDNSLSTEPVEVYLAKKSGVVTASVFQIATEGYGGTITLMVALTPEGEIIGLRTLSHKETPGLADKIEIDKSNWITGFNGESFIRTPKSNWAVKKDGGKFDQFTGATITPRAVVNGIVAGLEFYARHTEELLAE